MISNYDMNATQKEPIKKKNKDKRENQGYGSGIKQI